MIVQCESCWQYFDDEFRLTLCPHATFLVNNGHNLFAHYPESYLSLEPPYHPETYSLRKLRGED